MSLFFVSLSLSRALFLSPITFAIFFTSSFGYFGKIFFFIYILRSARHVGVRAKYQLAHADRPMSVERPIMRE